MYLCDGKEYFINKFRSQIMASVYESAYPIYVLTKCFGLSPYSSTESKSYKWIIDKKAKLRTVLTLIPSIVIGIYPIYLYQQFKMQEEPLELISVYSEIFRAYTGFIMALMTVMLSLYNGEKICKVMEDFHVFDDELKQLGIFIKHAKVRKAIQYNIALIYAVILFIIMNDFIIFAKFAYSLSHYAYWGVSTVFYLINVTAPVQFTCLVYVLNDRLRVINRAIDKIADKSNETAMTSNMINYISNKRDKTTIRFINVTPLTKNIIDTLRELHDSLCELSKVLNKLFALIILLMIARTFVVLIQKLYFFYLMLSQNEKYTLTIYKAWSCVIWSVAYFLLVYIICYWCTKAKNEAESTSVLLHKINVDLKDEEIRTSIEMFSLQMIHQTVEFSACGFFPIDFSVLYTTIGAVVTYLIISIQFEMSGREAQKQKI